MVKLSYVQKSNARIATEKMVAVFVGATSGIGLYTLKEFARQAIEPRVYFTGRSQEAGSRIEAECRALNPKGQFTFMKADTSLLKVVDEVCKTIKTKEKSVNLLFMTAGALVFDGSTAEDLPYALALAYYGRTRFILNLLPLIKAATGTRRVVTTLAGTKEGQIDVNDIQASKLSSPLKARGHLVSMITLTLEEIAKSAPTVSFIQDYPGFVKTNIGRDAKGAMWVILKVMGAVLGPFKYVPEKECGERHLFLSTSPLYPAADDAAAPLTDGGAALAKGSDGKVGSGVYTVDEFCESGGPQVLATLAGLRAKSVPQTIMQHTLEQYRRVTGVDALVS
jgi:NAD(P)-dependent dehydrogenase (short-subunit alcohol dehydrogenase family)